ncbi:MAG: hypothetical protein R3F33_11175 [Planctomycetota bacterium]
MTVSVEWDRHWQRYTTGALGLHGVLVIRGWLAWPICVPVYRHTGAGGRWACEGIPGMRPFEFEIATAEAVVVARLAERLARYIGGQYVLDLRSNPTGVLHSFARAARQGG